MNRFQNMNCGTRGKYCNGGVIFAFNLAWEYADQNGLPDTIQEVFKRLGWHKPKNNDYLL